MTWTRSLGDIYYIGFTRFHNFRSDDSDSAPSEVYFPNIYGGRPMFHKTVKGALSAAGVGGKVFAMNFTHLPEVIDTCMLPNKSSDPSSSMSELEFAERQVCMWAEVVKQLNSPAKGV